MNNEEFKNSGIKVPDLTHLKESVNYNSQKHKTPKIANSFFDDKSKTLVKIERELDDIKKNSKNPFWKSLLLAIIGGSVGFFLGLLFL